MRFMVIKKGPLPRARLVEGDARPTPRVQYIRYHTVVATNCRFRVIDESSGTEEVIDTLGCDPVGFAPPLPNSIRVVETDCTDTPLEAAPVFRPRTPPGKPPPRSMQPNYQLIPKPLPPQPPVPCLPPPPYPQRAPRLPRFTLIRRKVS